LEWHEQRGVMANERRKGAAPAEAEIAASFEMVHAGLLLRHKPLEQAGLCCLLGHRPHCRPHCRIEVAAEKHVTHLPHLRLGKGAGELEELRHNHGRVRLVLWSSCSVVCRTLLSGFRN